MTLNEKEFKKMVRKANYKRTSISVVISFFILIAVISGVGLPILSHYNYIDFWNKEVPKVKGLPDKTIKNISGTEGYLDLLFDHSGGFKINSEVKEMNVYLDFYEKGKLISHESVFSILADDKKSEINGTFYWGISEGGRQLSVSFTSTTGGVSKSGYDLKDFNLSDWTGVSSGFSVESRITDMERYLLFKYVKNENGILSSYNDKAEEFSEKRIKENDKLLLFYIDFK